MKIEWARDWEEQLQRAVQPQVKKIAKQNQPKMAALTKQYAGRPVKEIKPIVKQELKSMGFKIPDEAELTRVATAISQGQQVILEAKA